MNTDNLTLLLVPKEQWTEFLSVQQAILAEVKAIKNGGKNEVPVDYIPLKEYLKAVGIGRTKFDQLAHANKVKFVKKRRRIYVLRSEIQRYFTDPTVQ